MSAYILHKIADSMLTRSKAYRTDPHTCARGKSPVNTEFGRRIRSWLPDRHCDCACSDTTGSDKSGIKEGNLSVKRI